MSEQLEIHDWLDDEQDALTDELTAALAPRRPEPAPFEERVREKIRTADRTAAPSPAEPIASAHTAGRLSWVAGLVPPVLLPKGAAKAALGAGSTLAAKGGAKAALQAVTALAATPVFVLVMLVATLLYAVRGQLRIPGADEQRTDEHEAALALRAWWRRHLPLKVVALGAILVVALFGGASRLGDGLVLLLLGSTIAAVGQLGALADRGTASRAQVGKLMGGALLCAFLWSIQLHQFVEVPGSSSLAGPFERAAPYAVPPMLLLAALLCLALGKPAAGRTRRTALQVLGLWSASVVGLGVVWTTLGQHEVTTEDVARWVAEGRDGQLSDAARWQDIGAGLRLQAASGERATPLAPFEEAVHATLARADADWNTNYLLPLLRLDRALGSRCAADAFLPEVAQTRLSERRDDVDVTKRRVIDPSTSRAITLFGLRDPARFDDQVYEGVERMRRRLGGLRGADGGLERGPALDETLRRIAAACGDQAFERRWRSLVTAPDTDAEQIRAAGREEFVHRLLEAAPPPGRWRAVRDYVLAAEMLDFFERSDAARALQERVHRALLDTWTLRSDRLHGAFQGKGDDDERLDSGLLLEDRLSSTGWVDTTATAVAAMARWGVPDAPADGSRAGIDLLALESFLVESAREWRSQGVSSFSALAAGALARLRALPEFADQLAARRASAGLLDVLARMRITIAAALFAAVALVATLRAPRRVEP